VVGGLRPPLCALAVVALAGMPAAACGGEDCNDIGCTSGAYIEVPPIAARYPAASAVKLCIDGGCGTVQIRSFVPDELGIGITETDEGPIQKPGDSVTAQVRVVEGDRQLFASEELTVELVEGPEGACDPCTIAPIRLDPTTLQLVETQPVS
jgi:hypothetical protein